MQRVVDGSNDGLQHPDGEFLLYSLKGSSLQKIFLAWTVDPWYAILVHFDSPFPDTQYDVTVFTPLLSCRAEKKKVQRDLMVPPNSLGQMLNFGTSS